MTPEEFEQHRDLHARMVRKLSGELVEGSGEFPGDFAINTMVTLEMVILDVLAAVISPGGEDVVIDQLAESLKKHMPLVRRSIVEAVAKAEQAKQVLADVKLPDDAKPN